MKDFKEIFISIYGLKNSWVVISFAILHIGFLSLIGHWLGFFLGVCAWVFFVPGVIWLLEN